VQRRRETAGTAHITVVECEKVGVDAWMAGWGK